MTDGCQLDVFGKAKGMLATLGDVMLVGVFCCWSAVRWQRGHKDDARGYDKDPTGRDFDATASGDFGGPGAGLPPAALLP